MSSYLYDKFKGKYRVIADYDKNTGDYPRIEYTSSDGVKRYVLDPSFDDYYIPSLYNLEIRHGVRNNLTCYFFSTKQMLNILYKMCQEECKQEYERTTQNNIEVFECLVKNKIITDYELLDGEGCFSFKTDKMSIIAPYLKLRTYGNKINPTSVKNLPKNDYKIPEEEISLYNDLIHKKELKVFDVARKIRSANKEFASGLTKEQIAKKKESNMNYKQFASSCGMWEDYLKIIEKYIENE